MLLLCVKCEKAHLALEAGDFLLHRFPLSGNPYSLAWHRCFPMALQWGLVLTRGMSEVLLVQFVVTVEPLADVCISS